MIDFNNIQVKFCLFSNFWSIFKIVVNEKIQDPNYTFFDLLGNSIFLDFGFKYNLHLSFPIILSKLEEHPKFLTRI